MIETRKQCACLSEHRASGDNWHQCMCTVNLMTFDKPITVDHLSLNFAQCCLL